ncbi:MAG TPA: hypothetical protein VHH11_13815 [Gammaproteobacteria bacterium]|nr:hypothetical protein [Gammaproteobacteria bacterium]
MNRRAMAVAASAWTLATGTIVLTNVQLAMVMGSCWVLGLLALAAWYAWRGR